MNAPIGAQEFLNKLVRTSRVRDIDHDLRPKAHVTDSKRVAGTDIVHGDGRWFTFTVHVHFDSSWIVHFHLDDGQHQTRGGRAAGRTLAHAAARDAVSDMAVSWAETRTRVRKAQNYLESRAALMRWTPPPPRTPPPSLWRRFVNWILNMNSSKVPS